MSQSVPRPGGIAASRCRTLNEITSPIVPTGTMRLRPRQAEKLECLLRSARGRCGLLAPEELAAIDPHAVQDHCQLAGDRDTGTCHAPAFGDVLPQARNADHLVLRISSEWAAS